MSRVAAAFLALAGLVHAILGIAAIRRASDGGMSPARASAPTLTPTRDAPAPASQQPADPALQVGDHGGGLPPRLPVQKLLGSVLLFRQRVPLLRFLRRRYGSSAVVRMRAIPFGEVVLVFDPALIKPVLTAPADALHAGEGSKHMFENVLGSQGVLTLDEELAGYEDAVRRETERRIETWKVGETVTMADESRAIALEVILSCVFGADDAAGLDELRRVLERMLDISLLDTMWIFDPRLGRFGPWRGYTRTVERARQLVDELIDRRLDDPETEERTDILSLLIAAGQRDRAWLRDQMVNLLAAGHETTTTGLAGAVELLGRHPEIRKRARAGDDAYLDAVVNETLRIRTVIPAVPRQATCDVTLGRWRIPAGTTILLVGLAVHLNPEIYDDPEVFRPERFLDQRPGTYTWLAFGGGRRRCIGGAFAQMEMRVALRTILDQVDWEPASRRPERQVDLHVSIVPNRGARIRRTA